MRNPLTTVGLPLDRSTRSRCGPTIPPAVPAVMNTSALSPYSSRLVGWMLG
jgi:hypothetical protein